MVSQLMETHDQLAELQSVNGKAASATHLCTYVGKHRVHVLNVLIRADDCTSLQHCSRDCCVAVMGDAS